MATCTLTVRIATSLRLVMRNQALINASSGPGEGTSEVTTRTNECAGIAADTYEARMGSPGSFDDTDRTVGDRRALSWGVRYARLIFTSGFGLVDPDTYDGAEKRLLDELEGYADGARQEAATPVAYDVDGELVEVDE